MGIGIDGLQSLQEVWSGGAGQALADFSIPYFPGAVEAPVCLLARKSRQLTKSLCCASLSPSPDLDRNTQLGLAASAAGVSILGKEWLYHATVKVGEEARSKVR